MNSSIREESRERKIYRVTLAGSMVNLALVLFKFAAGVLGRSSAMMADAVHSLSDFITDIVVIVFVRISSKPVDKGHDYGHGKFETLATVCIGIVLFFVGTGIAWNSGTVIWYVLKGNVLPSPGMIAFWAAIVSIVLKELLYQYSVIQGRKLRSDAVIANAWHHRSDALSSVATAVGIGGAVFLGEKWTVLDPLAALLVSVFIMRVAIQLIKPSLDELMERSLPDEVEEEIERIVDGFDEVSELHNLRTRKIGDCYAIEFHVRMDGRISLAEAHDAVTRVEDGLKSYYGAGTHVIIHVEPRKIDEDETA